MVSYCLLETPTTLPLKIDCANLFFAPAAIATGTKTKIPDYGAFVVWYKTLVEGELLVVVAR